MMVFDVCDYQFLNSVMEIPNEVLGFSVEDAVVPCSGGVAVTTENHNIK